MQNLEQDRTILRELAQKTVEIAALPIQEEKKRLWRKLNGLKPERPMVSFDQVCWNELNIEGKLTLRCEDPECRVYEDRFRKTLFQWEYFPADMVVEDYIRVAKAISGAPTTVNNIPGALFGMTIREQTLSTDAANDVVSHRYENQFKTIDDVMEKIQMPVIGCDAAETKRRMEKARWLFDGIMPLREEGWGYDAYLSCWDPIAMWMSITDVIYGIIDEPEKMHALINRMVEAYMSMLDQLETQNLIYAYPQALVHTVNSTAVRWSSFLRISAPYGMIRGVSPKKRESPCRWQWDKQKVRAVRPPVAADGQKTGFRNRNWWDRLY
ncbi:MAG: hypothetical protein LBD47_13550 [Treponema sp.]|jgi:hypothetical protein|nr:hypothetical protein [Treponema sp.]